MPPASPSTTDAENKPTPIAAEAQPSQGAAEQQVAIRCDSSKTAARYANFCRVTGTPEELIIDFGLNTQPMGVPTEPIEISERIVMSYYTAKRMMAALQMSLQRHEAAFGVLETNVQKRVVPGLQQQTALTSRPSGRGGQRLSLCGSTAYDGRRSTVARGLHSIYILRLPRLPPLPTANLASFRSFAPRCPTTIATPDGKVIARAIPPLARPACDKRRTAPHTARNIDCSQFSGPVPVGSIVGRVGVRCSRGSCR